MVVEVDGVGLRRLHGKRAVIVLEAVVLVPGEHHGGGGGGRGRLGGGEVVRGGLSAEHLPQGVGGQVVAHVGVAEAGHRGEGGGRRRVRVGGGRGRVRVGVVRGGVSSGGRQGGRGEGRFGLGGRLAVVEVGVGGRLGRFRRALVWRQDGHDAHF